MKRFIVTVKILLLEFKINSKCNKKVMVDFFTMFKHKCNSDVSIISK